MMQPDFATAIQHEAAWKFMAWEQPAPHLGISANESFVQNTVLILYVIFVPEASTQR